jgi:uridine kinase
MIERLADDVARRARAAGRRRAPLVAVSGVDGSGKSTLAPALATGLGDRGIRAAVVTLDPWHTPAAVRFNADDPARHFYRYAFRWEELFERLIDPLRRRRALSLRLPLLRLADDAWYQHVYCRWGRTRTGAEGRVPRRGRCVNQGLCPVYAHRSQGRGRGPVPRRP